MTNNNCSPIITPTGTITPGNSNDPCGSTTGPFPDPYYIPPVAPAGTLVPFRPGTNIVCPANPSDQTSPWQLILSNDACIQDQYLTEALQIGGAIINIYKLLGVHEQCKLVDATGLGNAISNGDGGIYVSSNAFNKYQSEWHSAQTGSAVTASAFIGYDFGEIKTLDQSRRMYGVDTAINKHITAFAIKQDSNQTNRATQVRLEYSQDSLNWYGAGLATLPDNDCLNIILMRRSAPARYWRLRPTIFNGSGTGNGTCTSTQVVNGVTLTGNFGSYWGVQALQLYHNYMATETQNIQDAILMENRDRAYATDPIFNMGYYDLLDTATELSRFGIELPSQTFSIQLSFSATVATLGRPIIIGDIIELPSEQQYSPTMQPVKKWLEVTDVAWATNGYTPGWQPLLLKVTASPALASQETQDIFGDLAEEPVEGGLGLLDKGNGRNPNYQDFSNISRTISRVAEDAVPERGREGSGLIREWTAEELANAQAQGLPAGRLHSIGLHPTSSYVEDAMPPNNLPYTQGTALPAINVSTDGQYFRLIYTGLSQNVPARLYKFSKTKGRWEWKETDLRGKFNPTKPYLQEFLTSPTRIEENGILQRDVEFCDTVNSPVQPNAIPVK
jgi:hypothetical protein